MRKFFAFLLVGGLLMLSAIYTHQTASAQSDTTSESSNSSTLSSDNHNKGVAVLDEANTAITDYTERINAIVDTDDAANIAAAITSGSTLQEKLTSLQQQSFDITTSESYKSAVSSLMSASKNLSDATAALNAALNSRDSDNINTSLQRFRSTLQTFDSSVEEFNAAVDLYNAPIEQEQQTTGTLYVFVTIVTIVITIATFMWRPKKETAQQKELRIIAAKQSLWPLGGALVTTIWFFVSDGDYVILWGAILFGFLIYFKALAEAIAARKKLLKAIRRFRYFCYTHRKGNSTTALNYSSYLVALSLHLNHSF